MSVQPEDGRLRGSDCEGMSALFGRELQQHFGGKTEELCRTEDRQCDFAGCRCGVRSA